MTLDAPACIFAASVLCIAAVGLAKNIPIRIDKRSKLNFRASLTYTTTTSGEARVMINIDAMENWPTCW